MRETDSHIYFWGSFLSNFWWCDFELMLTEETLKFNTSEQAFMALKAIYFQDNDAFKSIMENPDGKTAKAIGRKIKNFDVAKWNSVSERCMKLACTAKFQQDEKLTKLLLDTGEKILVEASPVDKIWGVGLAEDDDRILDENNWQGENRLGKVLMQVRSVLHQNHYKT